ncbi:serine kinase [Neokomagataea tanensis]|uniref:Serine kinase n=1 Tax=Neokomagataea tanensis TaxID=661191 RepID=A0A4Y6V4X3_9PROT|nr:MULTISPECIES: HPr kinase/phosphatase C-terminal domain-containing protein [Neokomagataea]QDH24973.1 serine kinase [Neokomagataea tanensis]
MIPHSIHASCVARDGAAIVIYGPTGAGKSLLALALIEHGFTLVADDRVELGSEGASPPETIRGLIEVRGVGILAMPWVAPVPVRLAVALGRRADRLPQSEHDPQTGAVLLRILGSEYGDVSRVKAAFDACTGRYEWVAGAGK